MSESITVAQYKLLRKKAPKYHNRVTVIDGLRFDSKKEAARWTELKQLEQAGQIEELSRQVKCPLRVKGVLIGNYIADFAYQENGEQVLEDVKGAPITPVARLKLKLVSAIYNIDVKIVR